MTSYDLVISAQLGSYYVRSGLHPPKLMRLPCYIISSYSFAVYWLLITSQILSTKTRPLKLLITQNI